MLYVSLGATRERPRIRRCLRTLSSIALMEPWRRSERVRRLAAAETSFSICRDTASAARRRRAVSGFENWFAPSRLPCAVYAVGRGSRSGFLSARGQQRMGVPRDLSITGFNTKTRLSHQSGARREGRVANHLRPGRWNNPFSCLRAVNVYGLMRPTTSPGRVPRLSVWNAEGWD